MSKLNELNNLLKYHLNLKNLYPKEKLWRIQDSPIEGRGIFANRDIQPGEIIFIDYPLLIGPRVGSNFTFHCAVCCNINNLVACTKGCSLPVCSKNCELTKEHHKECEFIKKLSKGKIFHEISIEIFKGLAPLRAFLLDDVLKKFLQFFTYHFGIIHGTEVELMKQHLILTDKENKFLKLICSILDTNTFATIVRINDCQISVRALYPLSALLNHSCCPNVTHLYDSQQQMIVKAAVFIPKDSELHITYTSLLWGTGLRRLTQFVTKQFWCHCDRCKDPKEFGTCLSGLRCTLHDCKGLILPLDPLNNSSDWKCDTCESKVSNKNITTVHSILGKFLRSIGGKNIEQLIDLIKNKLWKLIPEKNHITYEVKVKVIWSLGHIQNYYWHDLTMELLDFKVQLCLDVLDVLTELKLGLCKMRGLILYELYRTRHEKYLRSKGNSTNSENDKQENIALLKEASDILENDLTSPQDVEDFINSQKT